MDLSQRAPMMMERLSISAREWFGALPTNRCARFFLKTVDTLFVGAYFLAQSSGRENVNAIALEAFESESRGLWFFVVTSGLAGCDGVIAPT